MKKLFLSSSIQEVAKEIAEHIDQTNLSLVYITTAAEGEDGNKQWLADDRNALRNVGFHVTDFTITKQSKQAIQSALRKFDIIYFAGGNTFYLLEKIQQAGCADIINEFIEQGKIYIGSSAGSIVAGPNIFPSSGIEAVEKAPNLHGYQGLGLVDFVILPHWGSADFKNLYLQKGLEYAYAEKHKLILLTNQQFMYVENNLYKIIDTSIQ